MYRLVKVTSTRHKYTSYFFFGTIIVDLKGLRIGKKI